MTFFDDIIIYSILGCILLFLDAVIDDDQVDYGTLIFCFFIWPIFVPIISYRLGSMVHNKLRSL